jgi:hypothetical protein
MVDLLKRRDLATNILNRGLPLTSCEENPVNASTLGYLTETFLKEGNKDVEVVTSLMRWAAIVFVARRTKRDINITKDIEEFGNKEQYLKLLSMSIQMGEDLIVKNTDMSTGELKWPFQSFLVTAPRQNDEQRAVVDALQRIAGGERVFEV